MTDDATLIRALKSPVIWLTIMAIGIQTVQAQTDLPEWVGITFAVVLAAFGVLGVYAKVTPVADPRSSNGSPLVVDVDAH